LTAPGRLHVLYLIDTLRPGGAERSLAALTPHYRDLGIKLDVATLVDTDGLQEELEAGGAELFSVGPGGGRVGQARRFADLVRERRPDLVHTTLFESDVIGRVGARAARTPVVSSLVSESYGPEHAADPDIRITRLRAAQAIDAFTARAAVRMHAVSERVAEVMSRRLFYPRSRIDVVPRGRDPAVLGRRTAARRDHTRGGLGVGHHTDVVLAVARQEPMKELDTLVSAFVHVLRAKPTSRLLIAGRHGGATAALERQIEQLGLLSSVTLLGERSDVAELLCAADVFVLSSRREGMPGSVIEAMALEVPVVATNLPQVREVAGADGALLVRPGDVEAFARGILGCLDERDATSQRVQHALIRFQRRFTITETARCMRLFYEESLPRS
jgi:glycosyltransferase involved in cell wall biosynthesis